MSLHPEDFADFFQAVHGRPPFPWQQRLVSHLADQGRWPDLLDLPTGSGKTAAIDAAVFHLALDADKGPERRAALRIAFVVDRRLVVDDAFARAEALARALAKPDAPPIVRAVAERLRLLAGADRPPLMVARLRGGAPREDDWAKTPCQPTILCSTVDQVGSRLLFRGYGVTDRMKPVHAGLLGSDALILLDEAHLSEPFRQTLRAIADEPSLHGGDPRPVQAALLTATPGEDRDGLCCFGLTEDDRANPILSRRLTAQKPTTLVEADAKRDRPEILAAEALRLVADLRDAGVAAPAVAVVVNRIGRARAVWKHLCHLSNGPETVLIIGRSRGVDRDALAKGLDGIRTGRDPRPETPLILVATQTIEAGVDIDLDGLVTDAAALDALRQRFGRLNRDGRPVPARGVIIAEKAERKAKKGGDPIYGTAIAETLDRLFPTGTETLDFGPLALDRTLAEVGLTGAAVRPLLAARPDAPVLMPAHVDLWTWTSPIPACDPEPALFLHGPDREPAAVQVVWRADVDYLIRSRSDARLRELMTLVPPRTAEALELPLHAARAWLTQADPGGLDLADVDAAALDGGGMTGEARPAFRWRGRDDDRSTVILPRDLRPGDLIVVPSNYGGCDRYGWDPGSGTPVRDVADQAAEPYASRRFTVRITEGLIRQAVEETEPPVDGESAKDRTERLDLKAYSLARTLRTALAEAGEGVAVDDLCDTLPPGLPRPMADAVERFRNMRRRKGRRDRPVYPYLPREDGPDGVVLVASRGVRDAAVTGTTHSLSGTEDDEYGSFIGARLSLRQHSTDVRTFAERFATGVGLAPSLTADLALAGWLHDAGKADPRFQRLLAGGDPFALELAAAEGDAAPLAKSASGRSPGGAWDRAGLPEGWRHEALSVRLALVNDRLQAATDRALVLWLVGTHHGRGRPFFDFRDAVDETGEGPRAVASVANLTPAALAPGDGPQCPGFTIPEDDAFGPRRDGDDDLRGLDWPGLFAMLKARYGPWGLARLEAVLRLADHRASEAATRTDDADGTEDGA